MIFYQLKNQYSFHYETSNFYFIIYLVSISLPIVFTPLIFSYISKIFIKLIYSII